LFAIYDSRLFAAKLGGTEDFKELAITAEFIETFRVVCPACRGKVVLKEDGTGIKCLECRRLYPVRNDIPVLVVEEATIEDEGPRQTA